MRTFNSNEVTSTTNGVTCLTRLLEIVLSTGTRVFMTDFDVDLVAPAFDATEQTWSSKGRLYMLRHTVKRRNEFK
jgi:hypothetical protein